jgi:hypothetical protein
MFELGLRLAFDKPTIIIKDEKTGYSFDTGVVEHIEYPSSLRFNQIVNFKERLKKAINATYDKSKADIHYSPFLKSFGKKIIPASIHSQEIPESQFILSELSKLGQEIKALRIDQMTYTSNNFKLSNFSIPPYGIVNKLIDEYQASTNNPNRKAMIDFLSRKLAEMNYNMSFDQINNMLTESDNWYRKMLRSK